MLLCVYVTTNFELLNPKSTNLKSSASSSTSDRYYSVAKGDSSIQVNVSSTGSFSGPGGTGSMAHVTVRMGPCSGQFNGLIVYGGQYTAIAQCSLGGPFNQNISIPIYGTASIDNGGSDSSSGTLHIVIK